MELILKRISDLPEQAAADLTGEELVIVGNNGVLELVPLSAIYANAQSQLDNVANLSVVTLADIQDQNFTDTYITYPLLAQAIQSLGLLLTPNQQQAFLQHLVNYNNPHRVTAEQVGLGNVSNLPILTESDLEANNYGNKYITYNILQAAAESLGFNDLSNVANYPPTTLSDIQNGVFGETYLTYNLLSQAVQSLNIVLPPLLRTEFLAHLTNYNNPHETTSTQVGLGNVVNLPVLTQADITAGNTSLEAYVTYNLLQAAVNSLPNTGILTASQKTAFLAHLVNYDNPHQVTAAQVGLGDVANLPPIAQSDINAVTSGGSPDDVYVTYDMLSAANTSLGYATGLGASAIITDSDITLTSVNVGVTLSTSNLSLLSGTKINFNYKLASAQTWSTFSSVSFVTGTLTYSDVITGLTENTTYNFQVTITNPNDATFVIDSNVLQLDTLGGSQLDSAANFNIVGTIDTDSSSAFTTANVNAVGVNIDVENGYAVATADNAACQIFQINQESGQPNFNRVDPTISFIPKNLLAQNTNGSDTKVYTTSNLDFKLPFGGSLTINSNNTLTTAVEGTDIEYSLETAFNGVKLEGRNFPINIEGHRAVFNNGYIYVVGGMTVYPTSGDATFNTTIYYAESNTNGELISNFLPLSVSLPEPCWQGQVFVNNNYLYVLGGGTVYSTSSTGVNTYTVTNNIYRFTISTTDGTLSGLTNVGQLPLALAGFGLAVYDNYVYIVGGFQDNLINPISTIYSAPIESDGTLLNWTNAGSLPIANNYNSAIIRYNNISKTAYIYIVGGGYETTSQANYGVYWASVSGGSVGPIQTYTYGYYESFSNDGLTQIQLPALFLIHDEIYYINRVSDFTDGTVPANHIFKINIDKSNGSVIDIEKWSSFHRVDVTYGEFVQSYNKIYAIGGTAFNSTKGQGWYPGVGILNYIYSCDLRTNNDACFPVIVGNLPNPLSYLEAVENNGVFYLLGGLINNFTYSNTNNVITVTGSTNNGTIIDNVYYLKSSDGVRYDSGSYTNGNPNLVAGTALPIPVYNGRAIVIGSNMYYLGGAINGGNTADIYSAPINSDGSLGSWTQSGSLPIANRSFGLIYVNDTSTQYLYMMGGDPNGRINTIYRAPVTNGTIGSWSLYDVLPSTLGYFNPVYVNGYIYIVDGSTNEDLLEAPSSTTSLEYVPLTYRVPVLSNGDLGQWESSNNKSFYIAPYGADGCVVAVINNYLYRIGGWVGFGYSNAANRAYIYENGDLGPWEELNIEYSGGVNHAGVIVSGNNLYIFGGQTNYNSLVAGAGSSVADEYNGSTTNISLIKIAQSSISAIGSYTLPTNITGIYYLDSINGYGTIVTNPSTFTITNYPQLTPAGSPVANGNILTQSYNSITNSGATILLGVAGLNKDDQVVQFKGTVYN